jgi:hypothetical protein
MWCLRLRSRGVPLAALLLWATRSDDRGCDPPRGCLVVDLCPPRRVWRAAALGYGGPAIENAVRAVVRPVQSSPLVYTGDGAGHGRPFLYAQLFVKNISSHPVRIRRCIATALDDEGQALFDWSVVGPDVLMRPGHRMGTLTPGSYGGEVAPAGVTLDAVLAVVRYRVSCEVFVWAGPFPTYDAPD